MSTRGSDELVTSREAELEARVERLERELAEARAALVAKPVMDRAQLLALTDSLPLLVSVIGRDHRYEFANKAYESWFGPEEGCVVGRHALDVLGPDAFERLRPHFDRALAGERVSFEAEISYRTGGARHVHATFAPRRAPEGEITGVVAMVVDLSRRFIDDSALRDSEARFRRLAETIREVFYLTDLRERKLLYVSPAFEAIWGRPVAEVMSRDRAYADAIHPDDQAAALAAYNRQAEGVETSVEYRIRRPDGAERWILDRSFPILDDEGRPCQAAGVAEDITERKQAEQRLREARRQAETEALERAAILGQLAEGVIVADAEGRITFVNEAAARIHGTAPLDIGVADYAQAYRLHTEAGEPYPPEALPLARAVRGETVTDARWIVRRADRDLLAIGSARPVYDAAGNRIGAVLTVRDDTAREMAEAAVRESEERAQLVQQAGRIGSFDWDIVADRAVLSPEFYALYGETPKASPTFAAWAARVHPDDRERVVHGIKEALARGGRYESEYRIVDATTGETRWVSSSGMVFHDEAGRPVRMVGGQTDITPRVRAEEAVRASEERLRLATEGAGMGTWDFDLRTQVGLWSDSAFKVLGYAPEPNGTWTFDMWADRVHPDDLRATRDAARRAKETGDTYGSEYRIRRADDGGERWVQAFGRYIADASGEPVRYVGIFFDITERKLAEMALREESRTLETLNRTGSAVAAELDLERIVQLVTDAGVELTGAGFGAFFYNALGDAGESFMLYTLSGVDRSAFDRYPMPRATAVFQPTFKGEGVIRSDDILADARYGRNAPHKGMPEGHLPVRSYLAVPVVSRSGEVIGGLFFGHAEAARFTERHERLMVGLAAQAAIAVDNARLFQAVQRELAERKAVEARLRESEERARLAVEGAELGVWDWDLEAGRGWWSPRTAEIMGVPSGEGIGFEQRVRLIHPDDRERVHASLVAAIGDGMETALDYRIVRPTGEVRWLVSRGIVSRNAEGRAIRITGIVQDVTEERAARDRLRESEERFRVIADAAPVPMWVTRLDRTREFVNRAYVEFLGISPEEALDFDWRGVIHPDDMQRIHAEQLEKEASLRPFTLEARYRNARGQWRWLRSESQPRWGAAGEHIGFIGVAYDVTIAKEAELALQELVADRTAELTESERRFRAIFDTTFQLTGLATLDGTILVANRAALDAAGATLAEVAGLRIWEAPWWAATPAEAQRVREGVARVAAGEFVRYEAELHLPEGRRIFDFSMKPILDDSGRPALLVAEGRDITDHKQAEEQLRQAQKMEAVGQLTGGVAHDFNNLLTPIMGSLDMLRRRLGVDERAQRTVDLALQATSRAATLVQRLLAFARRQDLQARSVDVAELLAGMEELVARSLGSGIRVTVDVASPLPPAHVDPNQLELAILNLAINARDAMPGGGTLAIGAGEVELRRAAPDLKAGRYVRISVADTGIGMDEATLKRAVEPFFSTKGVGKGTGLGLSMVHGLAAQLGGALRLSSNPGIGTTAEIWLPVAAEPAETASPDSAPPRRAERAATILLVDDEELVRAGTADMLADLGYRVVEAASGPEALARLGDGLAPDALVTDYLMPGMNGAELVAAVQGRWPGTPSLIISGYTNLDGRYADSPRLMKPFRQEELAAKVAALLKAGDA